LVFALSREEKRSKKKRKKWEKWFCYGWAVNCWYEVPGLLEQLYAIKS
jgi:hypothetical protein